MYKLIKNNTGEVCSISVVNTTKTIPLDENNYDYQAYLKWLEEGNTPLPADE